MAKIKIFSLGGLNENGKNTYIIEVNDGIYIYLEVIINYVYNINETMQLLRKKIIREIEKITAMNVLSMEIVVKGVNLEKSNKQQ